MFGLEALAGKALAGLGIVAALLIAWWLKGKAGERKGLQKAAEAARERERSAVEEVMAQRSRPVEPLGGMQRVKKPVRGPTRPPGGDKPAA